MNAGRLSNDERLIILNELGLEVQSRFNKNIKYNPHGYNLKLLLNSLHFAPDVNNFENYYWVDTGHDKLNELANYFEHGTGVHNTQFRRGPIVPIHADILWFRKEWMGIKAATMVQGVQPVFMKKNIGILMLAIHILIIIKNICL